MKHCLWLGTMLVMLAAAVRPAQGQSSSILKPKPATEAKDNDEHKGLTVSGTSWISVDLPKPKKIGKHDLLTVLIEEKTVVSLEDTFDRKSDIETKGVLKDWAWAVRGFEAEGKPLIRDPELNAKLEHEYEKKAKLEKTGQIVARMAVRVVDVKPNGTLAIEGTRTIVVDRVKRTFKLTGTVREEDLLPDNTVLSEDIAELNYQEDNEGKMRDTTKRGWLTWLLDKLNPF